MQHGLVLLDKREGITSAKAIAEIKRKLQLAKIGHAGTLDPMATGLLVCLTGNATRCAHYATEGRKTYSGEFLLGKVTTTDDVTGETLSSAKVDVTEKSLARAIAELTGHISQIPPQYSALKVDGKRAYDMARAGENVVLKARDVIVYRFEFERLGEIIKFTIESSSGTYIRSLARDLGTRLGCGGCLARLRREGSEPFSVKEAKLIDDITPSDIVPWGLLFPDARTLKLSPSSLARLRGGDQRELSEMAAEVREVKEGSPILFGDERPIGILLKRGQGLELGVYIG